MTQEEIIKLARKVGYPLVEYESAPYIPPMLEMLLDTVAASQRTWVGLTDDEIWEAYMKAPLTLDCSTDELYALARTVEAKLKDKNNV